MKPWDRLLIAGLIVTGLMIFGAVVYSYLGQSHALEVAVEAAKGRQKDLLDAIERKCVCK